MVGFSSPRTIPPSKTSVFNDFLTDVIPEVRWREETHPEQVDVGMLRRGQAQRVDLHKAERRHLARLGAAAQLPHHLVHRLSLSRPGHARHV